MGHLIENEVPRGTSFSSLAIDIGEHEGIPVLNVPNMPVHMPICIQFNENEDTKRVNKISFENQDR